MTVTTEMSGLLPTFERFHVNRGRKPHVSTKRKSPEEATTLLAELTKTKDSSVITNVLRRIGRLDKAVITGEIITKVTELVEHPSHPIQQSAEAALLRFSQMGIKVK